MGAQQVIYVEMLQFADSPDNVTPKPVAQCRVRVIDLNKHERVFPPSDGVDSAAGVQASLGEIDPEKLRSDTARLQTHQALAQETGAAIAKVFYKHEPRELGRRLNPK